MLCDACGEIPVASTSALSSRVTRVTSQVRHILTKLYGEEASMAPPPLRTLESHELVDSVVGDLLQCMALLAPEGLVDLTQQIEEHNPLPRRDIEENL
jgi:hypothetical protein